VINRGAEVLPPDRLVLHIGANLVRLSIDHPAADAAASQVWSLGIDVPRFCENVWVKSRPSRERETPVPQALSLDSERVLLILPWEEALGSPGKLHHPHGGVKAFTEVGKEVRVN
jgi:hypothetical protein